MAGNLTFPQVFQQALRDFGDRFANEPQRRHFVEYLTGLNVAARETVTAINAQFTHTTDQSCPNDDFVARLEFKLPPGGNNGLAIRYPRDKGDTASGGMCELQVLDGAYKGIDPRQDHGAVEVK